MLHISNSSSLCLPRHEESPLEIERRRRQLSLAPLRRVTSSTLEQSQGLTSVTRQRRQAEEAEEAETRPRAPPPELSPEQERGRRQTTDPDQLCPSLASFVMPRAAVNSQGEQENIGNTRSFLTLFLCVVQVTGCSL